MISLTVKQRGKSLFHCAIMKIQFNSTNIYIYEVLIICQEVSGTRHLPVNKTQNFLPLWSLHFSGEERRQSIN